MLMAEPALDDVVVEKKTSARMKLAWKRSCRAYLPPGATVSYVGKVKEPLIWSCGCWVLKTQFPNVSWAWVGIGT